MLPAKEMHAVGLGGTSSNPLWVFQEASGRAAPLSDPDLLSATMREHGLACVSLAPRATTSAPRAALV